jgi:undecaprenyl-diphosphatase
VIFRILLPRDDVGPAMWVRYYTDREPPKYLRLVFNRVDPLELVIVRRQAMLASGRFMSRVINGMTALGNGWIYPIFAIFLVAIFGRRALRPALLAVCSSAIAHLTYPTIKFYIARPRPTAKDRTLVSAHLPLDRYSCPSGHAMTATAVFVPLGVAYPILGPCLLIVWIMLVWPRLLLAHHYPSDLIIGAAFGGVAVAAASTIFMVLA